MRIRYTGDTGRASELQDILADEGLHVSHSAAPAQAAGRSAGQIYEVQMEGELHPAWQLIMTTAEVAVAKFRERHPDDDGVIEFEAEAADHNTPAPNLAWHVAT